ncbi:MAG TPA: glycoside hydrolase family 27 protein [Bryobacteraceae bacterium]|nr:glycoside hydrolase family 27 protein [Bryobacteraceae bacterium]
MKYLLLGIFGAVLAQTAPRADVTGRWAAETHLPNGTTRQTVIALKADGEKLTGYMSTRQEADEISEGKVNGSDISFDIVRNDFGEERRTHYTGTISGDELRLQMPGSGGRPGRELVAKRVSSEAAQPLPAPPLKITLPPLEDVPSNGLARTPPMGWNSWNKFRNKVSDQVVREIADAMASNGMKDAGYMYVNIDDTWEGTRDEQGNIRSNEKFPDMKALAEYVHSKGLRLGIYSSPGPKTCAGYEGTFKHEEQDAKTFAAWGIDYLKYDWCSAREVYDYHSLPAVYGIMGRALLNSGRPIVFSLCEYGRLNVGNWGARAGGNLWRTTGDIRDTWASMSSIGFDQQIGLEKFAGPGHWNDPDMLEIGNGGMSDTEYRTHMSLWSLLAAPLLAGNDLRSMTPDIREILTNKEVIAIDQDSLGQEATRVSKIGGVEVWARSLADGGHAVGLFNRGPETAKVTARWSDLGLSGSHKVRDLWAHADRGEATGEYSAEVPSHGVVLVKIAR